MKSFSVNKSCGGSLIRRRRAASAGRLTAIFLCFFLLAGCGKSTPGEEHLTVYYLCELDNEEVTSAVRGVQAPVGKNADKVTAAMKALFAGTNESGLKGPYPQGTSLTSLKYDLPRVTVGISSEYLELTGAELVLAEACAALTLCSIEGITEVSFTVNNRIHMSEGNVLSIDDIVTGDLVLRPVEKTATLYFSDGSPNYLTPEARNIVMRENEPPEKYVVEELLKGPANPALSEIIPKGTRLLSIAREDGTCYVNLSEEFLKCVEAGRESEIMALYSITNSLCALEGVEGVNYLVDGSRIYGSQIMREYADVVGAYRDNVISVTLYMNDKSNSYIVPVTSRAETAGGFDLPRTLIERLVTGIDGNGFLSMFPKGTRINSLTVEGDECIIDFSREFVENQAGDQPRELMLQSLAFTVSRNGIAGSVRIYIDGEPPADGAIYPDDSILHPDYLALNTDNTDKKP
ncbi:MAG: GerMN domain-containing protein [Oscillospiraceae bacterium]|jgi:germination protein M|nr:GerMN domain-containing protein [Oscillospiraceae bacterium]